MMTILAASVVGTWSYADFLADTTPNPEPAAVKASAPAVVEKPVKPTEPPRPTPSNPTPARRPVPSPAAVASKPTLYRSTDAFGQAWEHPDPAYLARFVEDRNRSLAIPFSLPSAVYRASRCANGRCN